MTRSQTPGNAMAEIRKRYNTQELADRIHLRSRRTSWYAVGGILVVVLLFAVMMMRPARDDRQAKTALRPATTAGKASADEPAATPGTQAAATPNPAADQGSSPSPSATDTTANAGSDAPTPPPSPPAAAARSAKVTVTAKAKVPLWVDGKPSGKANKRFELRLAAGTHQLRTKVGRKVLEHTLDVEPGGTYLVRVDGQKKRLTVERAN